MVTRNTIRGFKANEFVGFKGTEKEHPLFKRSSDSDKMLPYWDKVDAILDGYETVKAAGTDFLPKFNDESHTDYTKRLDLTKFTNIYRDVAEGLASKPFQNEVGIIGNEVPQEILDFAENVDAAGNNLTIFSSETFFNGINGGIDWIFVDYPNVSGERVMSLQEARRANIKPFWTHVLGRNVLEVRTTVIGSKQVIDFMRVLEPHDDSPDRVRVFMLVDGVVEWELYEKVEEAKKVEDQAVLVDSGSLSIPIIPFVPFITGRKEGNGWSIRPPMRDAVDLQVELYQEESALKFIKTMAGYPMLAANGVKPEKDESGQAKKIAVGPMRVLYSAPDGNGNHGQWSFIEPNANSMEFLKKSIDSTKQDLRELGRQPLTALSSQLTTVTTSIAAGKAKSAVGAWALILKDALENAFLLTTLYMGIEYEPEVYIYTDFDNVSDSNADIDNLLTARQNGDLSQETLWAEMKRRKVLSPEFTAEDEYARILNEVPSEMMEDDDNLTTVE